MTKVPFNPAELEVKGTFLNIKSVDNAPAEVPIWNTPITVRENMFKALKGEPMWMANSNDIVNIESRVNLDHVARAEVRDLGPAQPLEEKGGPDLFGIEWVFVPVAGGSMVKPGDPTLSDANEWYDKITFPDIDAMPWNEMAELNAPFKDETRVVGCCFQNGMFERLISFMDFEGAAMAVIDEDQQDAIHDLFDKLADMYIAMIKKYMEGANVCEVLFHDDWGTQRSPFFSLATCREMIVPHIKKVADFCHENGLIFQLHSCGCNELLVPAMIDIGVDIWSGQPMNDKDMLYEKYGKDIMLGIEAPVLPADATDEEVEEAAKAYVEKYSKYPIYASLRGAHPKFAEALYRQSRIAYAK
ncbi:MAG: methyltransferase [Anaerofustis stercorihominis]|nr:methyltransferase [Anaerofustis stercorihominis]